jgi:P-type Mg2+ transporter
MVILSIALNFFQAFRSERAVGRPREQVAPSATVMRDGKWIELPRREVVLLEQHLSVHAGIIDGRKAFGNVFKYILMGTSSNFGNMFSMAAAAVFLPFLPMLPTQILLNNFPYDLSQVTIPSDNVDLAYIRSPQRWNVRVIRNFMLLIGPISSIYDFLTFVIPLRVFHSSEALFHSGWFVESLATQTLVLFVIRAAGRPWSNRPSLPGNDDRTGGPVRPRIAVLAARGASRLRAAAGVVFHFPGLRATYMIMVELVKARLIRSFLLRTE